MALPRLTDYLPEESSDALKQALERYIADLESLPGLAEGDAVSAVREIEAEQAYLEPGDQGALLSAEYELAKLRLLKLRDRLLAGEAQKMSADAFWGEPPSDVDRDQMAERLSWTPKQRLDYLVDMVAFEERARSGRRRN